MNESSDCYEVRLTSCQIGLLAEWIRGLVVERRHALAVAVVPQRQNRTQQSPRSSQHER
jgi:hypothetical protein